MTDMRNPTGNPGEMTNFDNFNFSDLEIDDLFWLTNSKKDTFPHRKLSASSAINLKAQQQINIKPNTVVYIKN